MRENKLPHIIDTLEVKDSIRQAGGDWWLVWNIALIVVGTCAAVHWFHLDAEGPLMPVIQEAVDFYSFQIVVVQELMARLPFYLPSWLPDYVVLGLLFSLISLRATGPSGPGEEWPASGKRVDWLFHFAMWPLILLFYLFSIFHVIELVDRERLAFVRSTLLSFLAIAPVASMLVLIRDFTFYWTSIG